MRDSKQTEENLNESFSKAEEKIKGFTSLVDNMLNTLMPQTPAKIITIEVVVKKGFFGLGRVTKNITASAYISMNNIICFDISDKAEMKKYFDDLK